MGNNVNTCSANRTFSKRKRSPSSESFIIEYFKEHEHHNKSHDSELLDTRRTVFVSAMGLYQSWNQCPCAVLYAALVIIPFKKKWISDPLRYRQNISVYSGIDLDASDSEQFFAMLGWKDSQGLVCWMLDAYSSTLPTKDILSIHPVWLYINEILQGLYDPVSRTKYKPIPLDPKWWKSDDYVTKYHVQRSDVMTELFVPSLGFKCIQEMLYQSNPKSLCPLTRYSDCRQIVSKWSHQKLYDSSNKNDWCISEEYDPYDVDENALF